MERAQLQKWLTGKSTLNACVTKCTVCFVSNAGWLCCSSGTYKRVVKETPECWLVSDPDYRGNSEHTEDNAHGGAEGGGAEGGGGKGSAEEGAVEGGAEEGGAEEGGAEGEPRPKKQRTTSQQ